MSEPNKVRFFVLRDNVTVNSRGNPVGIIAYQIVPASAGRLDKIMYQVSCFNKKDAYDEEFGKILAARRLEKNPICIVEYKRFDEEHVLGMVVEHINRNKNAWAKIAAQVAETREGIRQSSDTFGFRTIRNKTRAIMYPSYCHLSQRVLDATKRFNRNVHTNKLRVQAIRVKKYTSQTSSKIRTYGVI